jgi:X-X-X-Leu-X-X-Gly heptad repeat protein
MTLDYAHEKLTAGVTTLAEGTERLQQRLYAAWLPQLGSVPAEDLPEDWPDRWRALSARVTARPAVGEEGTLAATLLAMTDDEAQEVAREVTEAWCAVDFHLRDQ